ncbi:MAG: NAD-dependent epimerase/dehydratase family protein [Gemmatimonadota bacterium]
MDRRGFLGAALASPAALRGAGLAGLERSLTRPTGHASAVGQERRALRILVLGGTGFIGPHMVRRALERGHDVTLFNRGRTNTDLFPEVEKLIGDRNGQLDALAGRSWDVVIDNSGYYPSHVRASAEALRSSVDHYIFTSTIDAYRDFNTVGMDESYPLHPPSSTRPEDPSRFYGPLKADCERIVREVYGANSTQVRPGWIAGPGDNNHLLTYWCVRIDRGGEVLAPGEPEDYMQVTDVRDLAAWYVQIAEERIAGAFSAVGPVWSWAETLHGIRAVTSADVSFTWVDADFLLERDQKPWTDIPLWWPARNGWGPRSFGGNIGGEGAFAIDGSLAWANGFARRPLADTAKSTLDWYWETFPDWPEDRRPGFSAAVERRLLEEWKART